MPTITEGEQEKVPLYIEDEMILVFEFWGKEYYLRTRGIEFTDDKPNVQIMN